MDFTLSEQHQRVRETAARVAREVVAPRAAEADREGKYPEDWFEAFRDNGLLALAAPVEYGGAGAGSLGLAIAIEEVSKYDSGAGLMLLTTRLATAGIVMAGTAEQREKYVRGVAEGRLRGCFALTEPEAGSDSANIQTTATRDGDDYVLNGTKLWAGQATVADFAMVVAKTDPAAGARGVSAFLVDLPNPSFRIVRELPKMGVLNVPVVEIDLRDCRVPAAALVGEENRGFLVVMRHLNVVRPLVAARCVGLAAGATQYALAYAQQRRTFGRPLIEHEAIAFDLAELAMEVEASRLLTYRAACLVDEGASGREVAHFLSMAKAKASEVAVRASERAVQILGGFGYLKDYAAERYYRDAKQLMIVEGTSEIHRLIISRALADGLLDWGYDVEAAGGLPHSPADKARRERLRQEYDERARQSAAPEEAVPEAVHGA
ncbi:MAG: acyl-CoA dehydrogenase family protein [Chloroflexota bacterium]|nr:acyl-CoA dehydrogenase family protein [Chloroflexota bacterium]